MCIYITYLQLYTLTDGGGVASREGICAETHEEAGFPHIRITHHQYLENIVRLSGQVLDELQGLQWEVRGQSSEYQEGCSLPTSTSVAREVTNDVVCIQAANITCTAPKPAP